MNKSIYIVINNSGLSGTEKRMISIWDKLVDKYINIYLILSKENYKLLKNNNEFSLKENQEKKIIIIYPKKNNFISYFFALLKIRKKINNNSIVHFPLIYSPLFIFFKNVKIITSWNSNYKPIINKKINIIHLIHIWLSFVKSYKIDILNPSSFQFMNKFKFLSNKLSLNTAGSFADPNIFKPVKKKNYITFLSRFTEGKGIFKFLDSLPELDKLISDYKIENVEVHICGDGEFKKLIQKRINSFIYKNLIIKIYHTNKPEEILSLSKIFLSLQDRTNYPSKSLVEAMISGCFPVIRNSGDSKKMLDNSYNIFISDNFNSNEINNAMLSILRLEENVFLKNSNNIRIDTIKKFNLQNSVNYYSYLYKTS